MNLVEAELLSIVPVLMALLFGLKKAGFPTKYIPLMALIGGLIIGLFISKGDIIRGLIIGASLSTMAIGTHSGVKNTIEK